MGRRDPVSVNMVTLNDYLNYWKSSGFKSTLSSTRSGYSRVHLTCTTTPVTSYPGPVGSGTPVDSG